MSTAAIVSFDDSLLALDLSGRVMNRLGAENIFRVGELCNCSADDLLRMPGFGSKSLREVQAALQRSGRSLRVGGRS